MEIYRQIGVFSAVIQMLYQTYILYPIYIYIYISYILELWVVTESITLWIQMEEIQFL